MSWRLIRQPKWADGDYFLIDPKDRIRGWCALGQWQIRYKSTGAPMTEKLRDMDCSEISEQEAAMIMFEGRG